ncbi:leucyl/phenylalanyl-tRNA--protein transferase [Stutzerimonas urumqiensis]|uniref:leucyl/phenylalanyl-tRNA--protein transferase n=1 Tax=Stutzerimonas urumqiensis TaxID=638269 RepID=UPI000EB40CED|nr:leucyl/phenylalanyl-tRNA--protein transferase [Stutzerimonas urumqiensis]
MLNWLPRDRYLFPPLEAALKKPNGLLAAGGDLSPGRLVAAYRHGCFPWFQEGQPPLWWSPDPRMVLYPSELHVSRSLRKTMRRGQFEVSFDRCFRNVIEACARPRLYAEGTWITSAMQDAYVTLHEQGIAHSVEVWQDERLVGGLYGLSMGRLFFGESMFSTVTDASKVGFVTLVERLKEWEFELIDCQMHTGHLASLGARPIARAQFRQCLERGLDQPTAASWVPGSTADELTRALP